MHTLADLLALPLFSDLTVMNPSVNLQRRIKNVDVTETPDVALYTSENVLIVTTGMAFKDDHEALKVFIQSLHDINAAGLAIKLNRFLGPLHNDIIAYANELDFPLIAIPASYTLGMLSHQMLDYILERQFNEIQYALNIQKHFSNLVMNNASLETIVHELSTTIHTQILLLDPFGNCIAKSKHFNRVHNPTPFYQEQIRPLILRNRLEVTSGSVYTLEQTLAEINVYPLNVNLKFPHYLVVFNPSSLDYPISQFAIDQTTLILNFAIFKTEQVENYMIGVQNAFFNTSILDIHEINDDFYKHSLSYGVIQSSHYQVITCSLHNIKTNIVDSTLYNPIIYQWLSLNLLPKLPRSLAFYDNSEQRIIILLQSSSQGLRELLLNVSENLSSFLEASVKFGIGRQVSSLLNVKDSYLESNKALYSQSGEDVVLYKSRGLMELFGSVQANDVQYFVRKVLKELAYTGDPTSVELRDTLNVYLDNHCEITRTAAILYLHRNTVSYRIKKCEEILNVSVKDPEVSLNLRLALQLHQQK